MPNPQRKPSNAQGIRERFSAGPCSDDPCFQSLADQLNDVLSPILQTFGGGGGGGENCAKSRLEKFGYTYYHNFTVRATSDELVPSRAFDGLAVSSLPAVSWLNRQHDPQPAYFWGVRDLPSSSSGSLQAFPLDTLDSPETTGFAALESPLLKTSAAAGPFLASPDGNFLGLTRKQGGSTAHFMVISIRPPIGDGFAGGASLPGIIGDIALPTNPTGPAEGIWLDRAPYVLFPTKGTTDLLYVIYVGGGIPSIVETITSAECTLTSITSVRVNQDETVMYVAGNGGVAAFDILDPAAPVETSAVATAGRQWDTLHLAQGSTATDGYLFVAERTSATNITTRTFDIDKDDPTAIAINTSKDLTGTFPATSYGTIRGMRGTPASWFGPHGVGCVSGPEGGQTSATVITFDLSDRANVSIKRTETITGLDTNNRYTIANFRAWTLSNAETIWLQRGLGVVVDTIRPISALTTVCRLQVGQIRFTAPGVLIAGETPLVIPEIWKNETITNLNADLLDGLHADAFLRGIGVSTENGVPRWGSEFGDVLEDTGVTIDDDDNLDVPGTLTVGTAISGYLLADGTVPLTANWDAGSFQIRAETFQSDVATGTAPFVVASTTEVANLNAALLGGRAESDFPLISGTPSADTMGIWADAESIKSGPTVLTPDADSIFIGGGGGSITTGIENFGLGPQAGLSLTTGSNNTAVGFAALRNTVGGSTNVAIGSAALRDNTSGGNNVGVGLDAGRRLTSGAGNETPHTSVYIGRGTTAAGANQFNQIVIGYLAAGNGGNTATLGNDSITATYLKGNVASAAKTLTLGAGATAFAVTSNVMTITGDGGGNTIATITGGLSGQRLTLIFVDALVTITDDNTHAANSVDLSAAFTSADDTVLELVFDGTSWYEVSRSVN
jgi:hypothetical protein